MCEGPTRRRPPNGVRGVSVGKRRDLTGEGSCPWFPHSASSGEGDRGGGAERRGGPGVRPGREGERIGRSPHWLLAPARTRVPSIRRTVVESPRGNAYVPCRVPTSLPPSSRYTSRWRT